MLLYHHASPSLQKWDVITLSGLDGQKTTPPCFPIKIPDQDGYLARGRQPRVDRAFEARNTTDMTPYDLLGVERGANIDDIKRAYRALAKNSTRTSMRAMKAQLIASRKSQQPTTCWPTGEKGLNSIATTPQSAARKTAYNPGKKAAPGSISRSMKVPANGP